MALTPIDLREPGVSLSLGATAGFNQPSTADLAFAPRIPIGAGISGYVEDVNAFAALGGGFSLANGNASNIQAGLGVLALTPFPPGVFAITDVHAGFRSSGNGPMSPLQDFSIGIGETFFVPLFVHPTAVAPIRLGADYNPVTGAVGVSISLVAGLPLS